MKKFPRRVISAEENALFQESLKDVRLLTQRTAPPVPPPLKATHAPVTRPSIPVDRGGEAPQIGGHTAARLRRAQLVPEARLDLHGYTQERAYAALSAFLRAGFTGDKRLLLVITGKSGVLRGALPRWLAAAEWRDMVSGLAPAAQKHGGSGAFYVTLKRRQKMQRP